MEERGDAAVTGAASRWGRLKVAVLLGGRSREREISLKTGENVAAALKELGHAVTTHDVTERLWEELREARPNVVFIALHGRWGEDGTVQGMLEILDLPYVGSGVMASGLAMHKHQAKLVFKGAGLPTPRWWTFPRDGAPTFHSVSRLNLPFPVVVKPNASGSAIGVEIVDSTEGALQAIRRVHEDDPLALVEEYLPGREVSVGVLGLAPPEALPVVEIVPKNAFYDYEAKYAPGMSDHLLPAPLPRPLYQEVQRLAVQAHQAIGCRAFSRADIWISHEKGPLLLEVNTLPGMTATSLFPEMARAAGISFPDLLQRLLSWALVPSARAAGASSSPP